MSGPTETQKGKEPQKGKEIRFIRGTYKGCTGWMNRAIKSSTCNVIVAHEGVEKVTRVLSSSVRNKWTEPTSFEHALVQQHADVELAMVALAELLAECGVRRNPEILALINTELTIARKKNDDSGVKTYRSVDWQGRTKRSLHDPNAMEGISSGC
ncbi:hypothetical protein SEMRO_608_G174830.1 [Seminavis robusta]|uniref:Uncharacterized protein n=1 Tax=Seminavis robusta TaxID=568900 RepID=A0A9N8E6Q9_9STRA|nr:hypothetical protein SEMRO_608_G174830.1 [Seminavis robusta]|eukprot:Sro608_g174830.1 n/a (155) ;mRNA; f:26872-27336